MEDDKGFLHSHPELEKHYKLNNNLVIVDKEDWKKAREAYYSNKSKKFFELVSVNNDIDKKEI